jgi:protein tyrosine phosphatase (PTP) superfamily phosphohydrolase (DUF442 family)
VEIRDIQPGDIEHARQLLLANGWTHRVADAGQWMRRLLCSVSFALLIVVSTSSFTQPLRLAAPNVVEISPRLVTSGQPTAEALTGLKALGDAVIYLAPPTVSDAVPDEQLIVTRQGLVFTNIPIRFDNPTEADFEKFASTLRELGSRKVLVHCQINLRASVMVFLYRATVLKEEPRVAYEAVAGVWSPDRR